MKTREELLIITDGDVLNTKELQEKYKVISFLAPYVILRNKETKKKASAMFQHMPRYYFNFREDWH